MESDIYSFLAQRLFGQGDPEGQGAAAASTAMEPAVNAHFAGIAQDWADQHQAEQARREQLQGLPLAQQMLDPESMQHAMDMAMSFGPGGMVNKGLGLAELIGSRLLGNAAPAAARALPETVVPSLSSAQIAQRVAGPAEQNFRPIEYGPSPISATADYQRIGSSNYGTGNSGSWIGRSSRFGDEDLAHAASAYNPRYDQSIYLGGQVRPPAPIPENPLLKENFAQMPVSYPLPYGPNTLPPAMNHTYNSRYSMYPGAATDATIRDYVAPQPSSAFTQAEGTYAPGTPANLNPQPTPGNFGRIDNTTTPTDVRYGDVTRSPPPANYQQMNEMRNVMYQGLIDLLNQNYRKILDRGVTFPPAAE